MRHRDKNHNPGRNIGIFLIILGLFIAAISFDVLQFGDTKDYFVWPMLLVFIGMIALFNGSAVGGIIMLAVGGYFMLPRLDFIFPAFFDKVYWPSAVVLVGLAFIISGVIRKNKGLN